MCVHVHDLQCVGTHTTALLWISEGNSEVDSFLLPLHVFWGWKSGHGLVWEALLQSSPFLVSLRGRCLSVTWPHAKALQENTYPYDYWVIDWTSHGFVECYLKKQLTNKLWSLGFESLAGIFMKIKQSIPSRTSCCQWWIELELSKKKTICPGEMGQKLRELAVLAKDHMRVHNYLYLQFQGIQHYLLANTTHQWYINRHSDITSHIKRNLKRKKKNLV